MERCIHLLKAVPCSGSEPCLKCHKNECVDVKVEDMTRAKGEFPES